MSFTHGTKELLNLSRLVLKARLGTSVALSFAGLYIGVPVWALGWFPLGLGLVVEDELSWSSCRR